MSTAAVAVYVISFLMRTISALHLKQKYLIFVNERLNVTPPKASSKSMPRTHIFNFYPIDDGPLTRKGTQITIK